MNVIAALAAFVLAITTLQHATTLKAGARIACVMETAIDSAHAQAGDTFKLRVTDPSYPLLDGSIIHGHITHVYQPHGLDRAEIAFLFDNIVFPNKSREPIRAFVVSRNVVQRTANSQPPPSLYGPVTMPNTVGPPNQSTMVWSTNFRVGGGGNKAAAPTAQTGGYAYAAAQNKPIVVQAGTPATIQLASDLQTP
ncbi:MAG TPA: hypothetical protein VK702_04935 [Candidatus Acidoferrum sp.]|nr:hypothetical protein [Candidatus Acidoferrum sp.]